MTLNDAYVCPVMANYFMIPGGFIGVTNETPKGPLRGVVLIGRGPKPGGDPSTVHEQAYPVADLDKLNTCRVDEVPDPWLEALKYDWPRPAPPPVEIEIDFLPEVFGRPPAEVEMNWVPIVLGAVLFIAALFVFWWIKRT